MEWPTREQIAREVLAVLYATDSPSHLMALLPQRMGNYEDWSGVAADRILALFPTPPAPTGRDGDREDG